MFGFINKTSLIFLLGLPILLLLIFLVLISNTGKENGTNNYNPYLKTLPVKYQSAIDNITFSDSTYYSTSIENYTSRELLVIIPFPSSEEAKTDFTLKLFEFDGASSKPTVSYNIVNDAAIYNYDGKTYGIIKQNIPFINFKSFQLHQKPKYKKQNVWKTKKTNPFSPVETVKATKSQYTKNKFKPNPYHLLFIKTLNANNIATLPYELKTVNDSLYLTHPEIRNFIIEQNVTLGHIENANYFWDLINTKDPKLANLISFEGNNSKQASQLLEQFIKGEITLESVFNINKLSDYLAVNAMFTNGQQKAIHFLYNSDNNILEPFFVNSIGVGETPKYIAKWNINNANSLNTFTKSLNLVSEINIEESIIDENLGLERQLKLINNYYPNIIFNSDVLKINQLLIKKSLDPSITIKVEVIRVEKGKLIVSILNKSNYPVYINGLSFQAKKTITELDAYSQILSNHKDTISIALPRSFENLFVSKKSKQTGFILAKHIHDLFISFTIGGIQNLKYAQIVPYQAKETTGEDLFRNQSTLENRSDISINKLKKIISFSNKNITITEPLIIPKGYTFFIKAGTQIDIKEGGKIISYAPLEFNGNKEAPIEIHSSDKKGQGLLVLSDGLESQLTYVKFNNLTNPQHGNWNVTGAISFYESPVKLLNVTINNNTSEDALNIIRSSFNMRYCTISNTQSDAFDGDFVKGVVFGCKFINLGNDAIDVSGSDLVIKKVVITNARDKGLSAGEDSKMTIDNVEISDSEIAVAGKDLSIVNINDLRVLNTKLGFTAFQKKPEFGPSNITATNIKLENVETNYLIESSSSLFVDGKKIESSLNVKDRMYGVEFGRSSAETRNTQQ